MSVEIISQSYPIAVSVPEMFDFGSRDPIVLGITALAANIAVPLIQFPKAQTIRLVDEIDTFRSDDYSPSGLAQRLRTPHGHPFGLSSSLQRLGDGTVLVSMRLPNLKSAAAGSINVLNEVDIEGLEQPEELPAFKITELNASRRFFGKKAIRPNNRGLGPQYFLDDLNASLRYLLTTQSDCRYIADK